MLNFQTPLLELWSELPEIDDMPYYLTKAEARIAMLKEVRETLLDSPKMREPKNSTSHYDKIEAVASIALKRI